MNNKIIDKIKKVLTLAERGVLGEKDVANTLLHQLLHKYNITIEELQNEEIKTYAYKYTSNNERKLIQQIIHSLTDKKFGRCKGHYIWAELTEVEHIEVSEAIRIYVKAFRKEYKKISNNICTAFIHRNDIFPKRKEEEDNKTSKKLTWQETQEIIALMNTMEETVIQKALKANGKMKRTK